MRPTIVRPDAQHKGLTFDAGPLLTVERGEGSRKDTGELVQDGDRLAAAVLAHQAASRVDDQPGRQGSVSVSRPRCAEGVVTLLP